MSKRAGKLVIGLFMAFSALLTSCAKAGAQEQPAPPKMLFEDTFDGREARAPKWTTVVGTWQVEGGKYVQKSAKGRAISCISERNFSNFTVEFKRSTASKWRRTTSTRCAGSLTGGRGGYSARCVSSLLCLLD